MQSVNVVFFDHTQSKPLILRVQNDRILYRFLLTLSEHRSRILKLRLVLIDASISSLRADVGFNRHFRPFSASIANLRADRGSIDFDQANRTPIATSRVDQS